MQKHSASKRNVFLALILSLSLGVVLFAILAASLDSAWLRQIDHQLIGVARTHLGASKGFFKSITLLGSDYVLGLIVLIAGVLLYRAAKMPELLTLVAIGAAAKLFEFGCKLLFQRDRPGLIDPATQFMGDFSFPSGHTLDSTAIYGFILALLAANLEQTFWKYLLLLAGIVLIFAVGLSRVVLRAHWPSDVMAGWLAGAVLVSLGAVLLLTHKGQV